MSACSVFIVVCLFCILYFICILLLLLPTWRIKLDDDDDIAFIRIQYGLPSSFFTYICPSNVILSNESCLMSDLAISSVD